MMGGRLLPVLAGATTLLLLFSASIEADTTTSSTSSAPPDDSTTALPTLVPTTTLPETTTAVSGSVITLLPEAKAPLCMGGGHSPGTALKINPGALPSRFKLDIATKLAVGASGYIVSRTAVPSDGSSAASRVFSLYTSSHFSGLALFYRIEGSSRTQFTMLFREFNIADSKEHMLELRFESGAGPDDPDTVHLLIDGDASAGVVELEGVIADCDVDTEDCATFLGRRGGVDADEDDVVQGCINSAELTAIGQTSSAASTTTTTTTTTTIATTTTTTTPAPTTTTTPAPTTTTNKPSSKFYCDPNDPKKSSEADCECPKTLGCAGGSCKQKGTDRDNLVCDVCLDTHVKFGNPKQCKKKVNCKASKITTGSLTGQSCQCPDKNCNSCEVTAEGSICKACRNSMYLFDGACYGSCDGIAGQTGLIASGVGTFKRRCLTEPFTCTKGYPRDSEGERLDVNYGCKCATADNAFHTPCYSCEFKAGGFGEECTVCKYKQYLHNGQCVESCPEGTTAAGEEKKGRTCE